MSQFYLKIRISTGPDGEKTASAQYLGGFIFGGFTTVFTAPTHGAAIVGLLRKVADEVERVRPKDQMDTFDPGI